jgi:hypothetical protein
LEESRDAASRLQNSHHDQAICVTRVVRMLVRLDVPDHDERTADEIAAVVEERLAKDCAGGWVECRVWVAAVEEDGEEGSRR